MSGKYSVLLLTMVSLALSEAFAAAAPYNCKSQAQTIRPQSAARTLTLVREWDDGMGVWMDDPFPDPLRPTPAERQIGCCWLQVDLVKGRDYMFAIPASADVDLSVRKRELGTHTQFHYVTMDGQKYVYVRASDWSLFDPASVGFHVKLFGGLGAVGKSVSLKFSEEKMPSQLGTVANPILLDVSTPGEYPCLDQPSEKQFNRWSLAFSASLVAGEDYVFKAYPPSSDVGIALTLPQGGWEAIQGSGSATACPEDGSLLVSVWKNYTLTFLAIPDDDHWDGTVAGGSLTWGFQNGGGLFRGSLVDADTKTVAAEFTIDCKNTGGRTSASATIIVKGVSYDFMPGDDGEIVGKTTVGGMDYESYFNVSLGGSGSLEVDGSMYLDDGNGGVREFFFSGDLGDGACVLTFDPNGGIGSVADMSCEWGKVYKLPTADALTPPGGKTLVGWRCSTEGRQKDRLYDPGMLVFNLAGEAGTPLKFVAVWSD